MTSVADRAAALLGGAVAQARRLSGGSLSEVTRVALVDGRTVVAKSGGTARAEAAMLDAIRATGAPAPEVLGVADDLLVLAAAADDGRLDGAAWQALAVALAKLHAPTAEPYGWLYDHAFSDVAIPNTRGDDWPAFWGAQRIAIHAAHVEPALARRLEHLAARLPALLPARPISVLLHGDLWGGNVLVGADAAITLIDPACYHGHREVDVAMLTLFDSPPAGFFDALALDAGWRERLPVYRLWPLLVHLRLFGSAYRGQVEAALAALGA